MMKEHDDLSHLSMLELFRVETENQTAILTSGLLELEKLSGIGCEASGNLTPDTSRLAPLLESLMRAAHSLKGAARIVNLSAAVQVAHAMEDCFVAAQRGETQLAQPVLDVLFRGVDLLAGLARDTKERARETESSQTLTTVSSVSATAERETAHAAEIQEFLSALATVTTRPSPTPALNHNIEAEKPESPVQSRELKVRKHRPAHTRPSPSQSLPNSGTSNAERALTAEPATSASGEGRPRSDYGLSSERVLRLAAENLNRLLGLASESLVESRWLRPFTDSMQRLKRMQSDLETTLDGLRQQWPGSGPEGQELSAGNSTLDPRFSDILAQAIQCREFLADRLAELDLFDRRSAHLSHRLYLEVLRTRMRPFGDGTQRFPRMVRDLARSLGKQARLEIVGENTQVDRDILERLETPLVHLLRNAVDHGCESPEQRVRVGKPAEARIRLEARHSAGMLMVLVSDDGAGIDPECLRRSITARELTTPLLANQMQESELLEFLFLPGFTMKDQVTEISGRGVGLDVVQNMVKAVRGNVRIFTQPGRGTKFQLQLPLTLSVLRTLLVEIAGEPYAIPLAQIAHTLKLPREQVEVLEGRNHFKLGDQQVGLLTAHEVLECPDWSGKAAVEARSAEWAPSMPHARPRWEFNEHARAVEAITEMDSLSVVVLGSAGRTGQLGTTADVRYGLVVDRFLGERELVVQPLDPRLGKVKDISAAALMEDGAPVLIVDVEDMARSIEKLITSGTLTCGPRFIGAGKVPTRKRKRVLAVDDSLTVRELERKLLLGRGYEADVAVDGMDGWNAVRTGAYDLVITDVDMPRMDGIELATLIKKDAQLKSLPVMIVSYKEREEDRLRGLNAGADYYLTKGSFHDERLLEAVVDLIGEPDA